VPAAGEKIDFAGIQFEVVEADAHRVNRVGLREVDAATPAGETEIQGREPVEG